MLGHKITMFCYIDQDANRVLASSERLTNLGPGYIEKPVTIECCCFCLYYNRTTQAFVLHHDDGSPDWLELPWNEWVEVDNPDETKTFSYQAKTFANRVLGIK